MAYSVSLKRKLLIDDTGRPSEKKAATSNRDINHTNLSPNSTQLCSRCLAIDIVTILSSEAPTLASGRKVVDLKGDPREWERSPCPLCQMFAVMRPRQSSDSAVEDLVLCKFRPTGWLRSSKPDTILLALLRKIDMKARSDASTEILESTKASGYISSVNPTDFREGSKTSFGRLIERESIDFDLLRHWLTSCQDRHHKTCTDEAAYSVASLKVIDCITRKVVHLPPKCNYIALSYVWGQSERDDAEVPHGISLLTQLPKTIEDAIAVTQALHRRYLWIDRYCIPQDDAKERDRNIRQMDLIYSGAHLTIIAAAGHDPDFGLPGVSSTHRVPQARIQIGNHTLCSTMEDPTRVIKHSTWMSRAWTFQEALFSRRRLVFTEQQVYYECMATSWTETVNFERDWPYGNMFVNQDITGRPRNIFKFVHEYSRRMLTYEKDVLKVFLGVFRAFEAGKHPVYHYWGVPILAPVIKDTNGSVESTSREIRQGFSIGLCWLASQPGRRRSGFPSWSWAGWTSQVVHVIEAWHNGLEEHATLALDISVELSSGKITDWDSFWLKYRSSTNDIGFSRFLHFESWTIPLELGTATHDPTMVDQPDDNTCSKPSRPGQSNYINISTRFYPAQQGSEGSDFDTEPGVHSLVGIILGDYQDSTSPIHTTFVLVAQRKEDRYECIGHMLFVFGHKYTRSVAGSREWVLDVPDEAYPFRNKSIQRIRLG